MAKVYKVKTRAIFNGQPVGSTIEMDGKSAKRYEAMKYVDIVEEVKPAKKATTPKKPAKKSTNKKADKGVKKDDK